MLGDFSTPDFVSALMHGSDVEQDAWNMLSLGPPGEGGQRDAPARPPPRHLRTRSSSPCRSSGCGILFVFCTIRGAVPQPR